MVMLFSYAINTQQKAESPHCFDVTAHVQTPSQPGHRHRATVDLQRETVGQNRTSSPPPVGHAGHAGDLRQAEADKGRHIHPELEDDSFTQFS